MGKEFDIYDFDIISDIEAEFDCESDGKSFIRSIEKSYKQELSDSDDMPLVYIGICLALNKRNIKIPKKLKENLIKSLKNKNLIERLKENEEYFKGFKKWRTKFLKVIENNNKIVQEKYISPFVNWRKNDVYAINISETSNNEQYVFLRVVDKQLEEGKYYPFVYLFIMPDFSKNFGLDTLDEIKYLPASTRFDELGVYDYIHQIVDDSLRSKFKKEIQYIGNYELKDPPNLVDTRGGGNVYSRLSLLSIDVDVKAGLQICDRIERGDRVSSMMNMFKYLSEEERIRINYKEKKPLKKKIPPPPFEVFLKIISGEIKMEDYIKQAEKEMEQKDKN